MSGGLRLGPLRAAAGLDFSAGLARVGHPPWRGTRVTERAPSGTADGPRRRRLNSRPGQPGPRRETTMVAGSGGMQNVPCYVISMNLPD